MTRAISKLENTLITSNIKLDKLKTRHQNTQKGLNDVDREKLELKIAKLEMTNAKNEAKLRKLKAKVK